MKALAETRTGGGAVGWYPHSIGSPWTALQARRTAGAWGWWWWHCGWTGRQRESLDFLGSAPWPRHCSQPWLCCFQTWTLPVPHQASDDLANFICFTSCQSPTQP
ncbi:hypothetical protein CABS03_10232 [Colletotrichum abscissum]|uniref:Uncharacterized protein n=1 Tax=Colletotrichum abscissum TaxID=1671311 RepID=A0A9Q0B8I8_9PEZI|nr:hypothetical protein CABS02_03911 [Colletotrichum abscissum]